MTARCSALLAVAAALTLLCGCMDPSVYRSPAGPRSPSPTVRRQPDTPARKQPREGQLVAQTAQAPSPVDANNVTITIEKIDADAQTARQADFAFRYGGTNVSVQSVGNRGAQRNGLWVGLASGSFHAAARGSSRRSRHTSRTAMFVVVANGQEGQILVGSDTYVQRLGYWTPHGYHVLLERQMVGRSLVVRPRILPRRRIEIELWPRFTARRPGGVIDVTELATKVVVRDGQSIVIGGLTAGAEDVGSVLFGVGARARTSVMTMILTPRIGAATIDWPKGTW